MRQKTLVGLRLALVTALVWAGATTRADACSCVNTPVCQSLWEDGHPQSVFFVATVDTVAGNADANGFLAVHLRDLRDLRGRGATEVITSAWGDSCGFPFAPGRRYLVEAERRDDGRLIVTRCSATALLSSASETLGYLESLARPARGGRIHGEVFSEMPAAGLFDDEDRQPVPGVRVRLTGPVVRGATTARDGRFMFDRLPAGTYTISPSPVAGMRLRDAAPVSIVLPNARACASTRVFFDRPRR